MGDPAQTRSDLVVAARILAGQGTCHAWELIARGLQYHQLDRDQLPDLIACLRQGGDWGSGELGFEVWAERQVRISFLDEEETYPLDRLIDQLIALGSGR